MKAIVYGIGLLSCIVLASSQAVGQPFQIKGYVTAIDSKEPLVGVVLRDTLSGRMAITDGYGFYNMALPDTAACLLLQYPGYSDRLACGVYASGRQYDFSLIRLSILATVEVRASSGRDPVEHLYSGWAELPVNTIKTLPQLGGEADLLKTLALMPGMSLGVEGSTGLFIRGGTPDQNLVLLDDAPVYNLSHFGPLLSVFNMDVVKHVRIMKGAWPAQYGGRLSGLVDIRTREGNMRHWGGQASISPLLGRFTFEGPLLRDKTAVLVSARSSWLGGLLSLAADEQMQQRYLMYDWNGKLTHHFNDRHKLYLSFYSSLDDSQVTEESPRFGSAGLLESASNRVGVRWGNQTASARYSTYFNDSWSLQGILYYTRYRYTGSQQEEEIFRDGRVAESLQSSTSANRDLGFKLLLSHYAAHYRIDIGVEQVAQSFQPQSAFVTNADSANFVSRSDAWQQNYFASIDWWPDRALSGNLSFRQAFFQTGGVTYASAEPRLSLRWRTAPNLAFKASASRGSQFLHLLTTGNVGLTNEVWVGSTAAVPPQRGRQASAGITWRHLRSGLEVEAEVFARRMEGLVEFKPLRNDELFKLSDWESLIETGGIGRVQGLELLLRPRPGRLSGWVAYTLSRNRRRFERINDGEWFPFRFDRRHDLSVVAQYRLSERWQLSLAWIYQTGVAITLPVARIPGAAQFIGGNNTLVGTDVLGPRNNARMPAYHRLDLSAVRTWIGKKGGHTHTLSFSIYNTYNRINPYFLRLDSAPIIGPNGQYLGQTPTTVTVVGLYPLIPAVSYGLEFGGSRERQAEKD
ncbi:MAG TPA: TonB-dependent receptor plug domain-containing protein [Saprospiraceae bacterium]|nr:TonB-dependent receptor plug domain-containing protein [Saprospiraceae bacterium]HMP23269.1 TonB-dependent receptor plug domain-containing protein [Saprospiraceae bacterium]